MLRAIEKSTPKVIIDLLKKFNVGINSMVNSYNNLFTEEEIALLSSISKLITINIPKIENNILKSEEIYNLLCYEDILKSYSYRCFDYEYKNGYRYVSWFKKDSLEGMPTIISATFSKDMSDTFCNASYGISYEVTLDGFLGANNKDAATLIEDSSKISIYTIGKTNNGKIVNSYNLATLVITPVELFDKTFNDYKSKHAEIILDSRFIKPLSVVCTNDSNLDMVDLISSKFNIPIENIQLPKPVK